MLIVKLDEADEDEIDGEVEAYLCDSNSRYPHVPPPGKHSPDSLRRRNVLVRDNEGQRHRRRRPPNILVARPDILEPLSTCP